MGDSIIWIFMKEEYKEMGNLSKEINDKNGFLVKLRNENYFDADMFKTIKDTIVSDSSIWRMTGSVPLEDVVALAYLIDQLAGGSRFLDEYTAVQVENANLEILRLLTVLYLLCNARLIRPIGFESNNTVIILSAVNIRQQAKDTYV